MTYLIQIVTPSPAKPKHKHRYIEFTKQQSHIETRLRTKAPCQEQDHKVFCGRPNKEKDYEANNKEEKEGRAKHGIKRIADVCVNLIGIKATSQLITTYNHHLQKVS
jgi:hypothetical protein